MKLKLPRINSQNEQFISRNENCSVNALEERKVTSHLLIKKINSSELTDKITGGDQERSNFISRNRSVDFTIWKNNQFPNHSPNDEILNNLKNKISRYDKYVKPKLNNRGAKFVSAPISNNIDEIPTDIIGNKYDISPRYLNNCNDYNIKEGDRQDEKRVFKLSTKPAYDYSNVCDYMYEVKNPPNIQINMWPKFYEK